MTPIAELILATNPTMEGKATAHYIASHIDTTHILARVSRMVYPLAASWNIWMAAPLVMLSVHARFWKFNLLMRNNYAGKT